MSEILKILHTIPTFWPALRWGGPILALTELTQEQVRQGHEVTVLTTDLDVDGRSNVPLRQPVMMQGVQVWYSPAIRSHGLDYASFTGQFLKANLHNFEVVHVHSLFSWTPTVSAFWALRRRIPYIVRPAGALGSMCLAKPYEKPLRAFVSRTKKWAYFRTLSRMVLDRASALHFCTEQERSEAQALGLEAPSVIVPLGVAAPATKTIDSGASLRKRFPVLQNRPIVLYLARLDRIKGLDLLIRALGDLVRSGCEFGFVVAGDGPETYRREMLSLVEREGIAPFTFFLGPIFGENKQQILREADLFALTSHHENFGVAILEAMAAGLPVLISRNVAIHDEVVRGGAGICTGLAPSEIASGLKTLLESKTLRDQMGNRGRQLVNQRFAWPRVAEQLTDVYRHLINAGPSGESHTAKQEADSVRGSVGKRYDKAANA